MPRSQVLFQRLYEKATVIAPIPNSAQNERTRDVEPNGYGAGWFAQHVAAHDLDAHLGLEWPRLIGPLHARVGCVDIDISGVASQFASRATSPSAIGLPLSTTFADPIAIGIALAPLRVVGVPTGGATLNPSRRWFSSNHYTGDIRRCKSNARLPRLLHHRPKPPQRFNLHLSHALTANPHLVPDCL